MYQHGKRTRQKKNAGVFLATVIVVGVVVLVAWYIVHKDIGNATGPKTNVPILTEVGAGNGEEKLEINENLFYFELPSDWRLQSKESNENVNYYIWAATKKGANDRRLTLHIDKMPQSYKLVKMQPLTPNGSKFMLGNLSDDCVNFADVKKGDNTPVNAKWENVSFLCDPIKANQTIGTGTPDGSIGTTLGRHKYYFFYEDHNIHPDSNILREALQSFQAK